MSKRFLPLLPYRTSRKRALVRGESSFNKRLRMMRTGTCFDEYLPYRYTRLGEMPKRLAGVVEAFN